MTSHTGRKAAARFFYNSPNVPLRHLHAKWSSEGVRQWYESLARSFTVVRYDHRGVGLSSRGASSQSIDSLVEDIDAIANEVATAPFVLLGWITGDLKHKKYLHFEDRKPLGNLYVTLLQYMGI